MSTIVTRSGKGSPLTNTEVDTNFTNLNADKYQSGDSPTFADIIADSIQLTGGTGDQATISWNTDEDTIDVIMDGSVLQVGQEVVYNVRNNSGSTIPDGTPVMATGTLGASGRITISPMDGTDIDNSRRFIGITTEEIANDADGKVTFFGKVRGINLTSYSEGDILWISTSTAGAFTATEPTSGTRIAFGFVISNASNGTMFVRADNGHALHESHDVTITTPSTNDVLSYDGSKWVNLSLLTAIQGVDGSGSGIDADLLDGQHGSYYTGYTDTAIANLVASAPATLDTLNELAAALGDDANFSTTVTNSIATKMPIAGGTFTGNVDFSAGIDVTGNITVTGTVDGRDVATDGTKLDGIEAGATADQTASEILTAIKTVDGSGSGLDADLLDGYHVGTSGSTIPLLSTANTWSNNQVFDISSSGDAVRITQNGSGNALVVEDSTNPDSSPFVVNSDGKVVVGHTEPMQIGPTFRPQIQSLSTGSGASIAAARFSTAASTSVDLLRSRGTTVGTYTIVQNGDSLGKLNFWVVDGTKGVQAAQIEAYVDGTPGTNDMPGRLVFSTTAGGASSPTERMRITSAGYVGIGTSSPSEKLDVSGNIKVSGTASFGGGTGTAGQVLTSNGASAPTWQTTTGKSIVMSMVFGL